MRIVYKRSLALICCLIVVVGLIGIGYLFYDNAINNPTLVIVQDELSINYLDADSVVSSGEYRFSVTNSGVNDVNYRIILSDIVGYSSVVTYILSSSSMDINGEEKGLDSEENIVLDNIYIESGETQTFALKVLNNNSTTFKIEVEKVDDVEEYFYMTLLNQNEIVEPITTIGEEVAVTAEGLIKSTDDDGVTYYFRGAVTNNYVSFAGVLWRIVRINGDGSVRMILNDIADTVANYNSDTDDYEDLQNADIMDYLNQYYESYLEDYASYIANTKFCSESGNTDGVYNAYTRIVINKIPTFNCLGQRFTSKVGLISVDELIYAGALYNEENESYYLYNEEIDNVWWTSSLSNGNSDSYYPFIITESGELDDNVSGTLYRGLRPVISLSRTVTVTGTGTLDDPYVLTDV